ncbi:MAG: S-methyl-5-thioribose-1-phosphate isomerase [Pseudomonadota bacterium]
MKIDGVPFRTIWPSADGGAAEILDQTLFPHRFETLRLETLEQAAHAIRVMQVRGAPLIGATAAYGVALAMREDPSESALSLACETLLATRPTAVNLHWALERMKAALRPLEAHDRPAAAWAEAAAICDEDVAINSAIGDHGLKILQQIAARKPAGEPLRVLTHCNAGWLATVDWGTATAPIYKAHDAGLPIEVWVDETRPRNQGAFLTAWELGRHGVPHKVITDNAGGHLMQRGLVDLVITGTDRTTARGDVCNKIGTYLKALAAKDNSVPFYVALPSPTIDFAVEDGFDIPIEERDPREVTHIPGLTDEGAYEQVRLTPADSPAANPAFDVTPARLVTALITERGVCEATKAGIAALFPDRAAA